MKRQRVVRAMTSFLLTLLLVCACAVPGFAVSADRLTAAEQQIDIRHRSLVWNRDGFIR